MTIITVRPNYVGLPLGQTASNVYTYLSSGTDAPDLNEVASNWYDKAWPLQRVFTSVSVAIASIEVEIPGSTLLTGIYVPLSSATTYAGTVGGDAMPPYTAFDFRVRRSTRFTRDGRKRLPGVMEGVQSGGVVNGDVFTQMQTFATGVFSFLGDGVAFTIGIPVTSPAGVVNGVNTAIAVEAQQYLTTQNSRKRGRGQ